MTTDQGRAFGHIFQRGAIFWIRFRVAGKEFRESSGSTSERKAEQLLGRRQTEFGRGDYVEVAARRTTFEQIKALVISDYRAQGYRSLDRLQQLYRHLGTAFGGRRATAITGQKLIEYRDARLAEGAAPATVDLELRALARGFRLARKLHRVAVMPEFPELEGARIREGFFETADFEAVLRELPAHLQPPLTFAFYSGWRVSEVCGLTWIAWTSPPASSGSTWARPRAGRAAPCRSTSCRRSGRCSRSSAPRRPPSSAGRASWCGGCSGTATAARSRTSAAPGAQRAGARRGPARARSASSCGPPCSSGSCTTCAGPRCGTWCARASPRRRRCF